tara:strand:- start:514 stop:624 length:111 start_codon:yes stop_codon:yes gene_type:complete
MAGHSYGQPLEKTLGLHPIKRAKKNKIRLNKFFIIL